MGRSSSPKHRQSKVLVAVLLSERELGEVVCRVGTHRGFHLTQRC